MESESDDEVFVGKITEREMQNPSFGSRRRTTLYFPGISRPDSTVKVFKETTEDGTLIFSCEDWMDSSDSLGDGDRKRDNQSSDIACNRPMLPTSSPNQTGLDKTGLPMSCDAVSGDSCNSFASINDRNTGEVGYKMNDSGYASVHGVRFSSADRMGSSTSSAFSLDTESMEYLSSEETDKSASPEIEQEDRKSQWRERSSSGDAVCDTLDIVSSKASSGSTFPNEKIDTISLPVSVTKTTPMTMRHIMCGRQVCGQDTASHDIVHVLTPGLKSKSKDFGNVSPIIKDFPSIHPAGVDNPAVGSPDDVQLVSPLKTKLQFSNLCDLKTHSQDSNDCDMEPVDRKERALNSLSDSDTASCALVGSQDSMCSDSFLIPVTPNVSSSYILPQQGKQGGQSSLLADEDLKVYGSETSEMKALEQRTQEATIGATSDLTAEARSPPCGTKHGPLGHQGNASPSQSPVNSPDLFSSPAFKGKSTPQQFKRASDISSEMVPCYSSPSPKPTSSVFLKEALKPKTPLLQPIREDDSVMASPPNVPDCDQPMANTDGSALTPLRGVRSGVRGHLAGLFPQGIDIKRKYPQLAKRLALSGKENEAAAGHLSPSGLSHQEMERRHRIMLRTYKQGLAMAHSAGSRGGNFPRAGESMDCVPAADEEDVGLNLDNSSDYYSPLQPVPHNLVPLGSPSRLAYQTSKQEQIEDSAREAVTRVNTVINGGRRYVELDPQSSPAFLSEFPPPKEATRVSWSETLAEEPNPRPSPVLNAIAAPRSILQQRSTDHEFPFSQDPPSPIVLTKRRLPRASRLFSDEG